MSIKEKGRKKRQENGTEKGKDAGSGTRTLSHRHFSSAAWWRKEGIHLYYATITIYIHIYLLLSLLGPFLKQSKKQGG